MTDHAIVANQNAFHDFEMSVSLFLVKQIYDRRDWVLWSAVDSVAYGICDQWGGMSVFREYDRVGVAQVAYLPDPDTVVEDEPNHGGHTCSWLASLAYAQVLQNALLALSDRSREGGSESVTEGDGWCFYDDRLFFDPLNEAVHKVIEQLELPDYVTGVYEDRLSELESEYVTDVAWPAWWDMHENAIDGTVDKERTEQAFLDYETSGCTQCHTSTEPETVFEDIAHECPECGDTWTDKSRSKCEYC